MEEQSAEQVMEQEICNRAGQYFGNGYHCAEAVVAAVLEGMGQNGAIANATAHATVFGGGFGKTFCEACGALSGGLIVIGHFHGRREPGEDWDLPAELGASLRQMFIDRFGTTHCQTLRDGFGDQDQMDECRNLVEGVTRDCLSLF